jgi:hypothetical protein
MYYHEYDQGDTERYNKDSDHRILPLNSAIEKLEMDLNLEDPQSQPPKHRDEVQQVKNAVSPSLKRTLSCSVTRIL